MTVRYVVFIVSFLILFYYFLSYWYNGTNIIKERACINSTKKYITVNFVEYDTGRIGNFLYRFASLYGLGRDLNREVYFDGNNDKTASSISEAGEIFPLIHGKAHIEFPKERDIYKAKQIAQQDDGYNDVVDGNLNSLKNIKSKYLEIGGNYLQVYKFFHQYRSEIKQIYTCRRSLMNSVKEYAKKIFKPDDESHKFCVHIRRTDFIKFYLEATSKEFLIPALNFSISHLKKFKYIKNVSLLLIGDDPQFAKDLNLNNLPIANKYISENQTKGADICLAINYCNSFLLSAPGSTFGWWMAYLLPDNTPIFLNSKIVKSVYGISGKNRWEEDVFPKEWISIKVEKGNAFREIKWYQYNYSKILF